MNMFGTKAVEGSKPGGGGGVKAHLPTVKSTSLSDIFPSKRAMAAMMGGMRIRKIFSTAATKRHQRVNPATPANS